jgi:hypothetical protein
MAWPLAGSPGSFAKLVGCHSNREPIEIVQEAGLMMISAARTFSVFFI